MGSNNSLTDEEFDAVVNETKSLSIRGLKTFVKSKKDIIEENISSASHFLMVKHPPNPQFIPCKEGIEGAIPAKDVNLRNVIPPTIRFKHLSQQPAKSSKVLCSSYRNRMKLTSQDWNKVKGVKDDKDEYSEEMYASYIKLQECISEP